MGRRRTAVVVPLAFLLVTASGVPGAASAAARNETVVAPDGTRAPLPSESGPFPRRHGFVTGSGAGIDRLKYKPGTGDVKWGPGLALNGSIGFFLIPQLALGGRLALLTAPGFEAGAFLYGLDAQWWPGDRAYLGFTVGPMMSYTPDTRGYAARAGFLFWSRSTIDDLRTLGAGGEITWDGAGRPIGVTLQLETHFTYRWPPHAPGP